MNKHQSSPSIVRAAIAALVACAACTLAVAASAAEQSRQAGPAFKPAGKWGKQGTANGQFGANAYGLAADRSGVYVADTDNHRVQAFSASGGFKRSYGFALSESVEDVAVAPDGTVWGTALQAGEARSFGGGSETLSVAQGGALGIAVDAKGNVYVSSSIDNSHLVTRFDNGASGLTKGKTFGGLSAPGDVETSADGSFYVVDGLTVKRFVGDRMVKVIRGGAAKPIGIGVDLDCNLWMTNIAQRNLTKLSPSGKVLGTVTSGDLIAQDVVVGPTGDLYAYDSGAHSVVRFKEDRTRPAAASVAGGVTVSGGVAKVRYTLTGVACPARVDAVASLKGAGVSGKAKVTVPAGKTTVIEIPLAKAPPRGSRATFSIVLKTNGRPTTETRAVVVG